MKEYKTIGIADSEWKLLSIEGHLRAVWMVKPLVNYD